MKSWATGGVLSLVPCHRDWGRRAQSFSAPVALFTLLLVSSSCEFQRPEQSVWRPLSGTFDYTKTEGTFLVGGAGRYEVLVPQTREIWIGHDGSGRLRTTFGSPIFFGERDREEWQDQPEWLREPLVDETSLHGFSYRDVSDLPHDPDALLEHILSGLGPSDAGLRPASWEVFIAARGILWETVPPQDISAAVLALLSRTPDIEVEEGDVDLSARPATRFSVVSPGGQSRKVMWLDPGTGTLLGEQEELLAPAPTIDAAPPVVIKRATYLSSAVVASTEDR